MVTIKRKRGFSDTMTTMTRKWSNALVLLENGIFQKTSVYTENGIIRAIGGDADADEIIDCSGKYLLPGLVPSSQSRT